MQAKNEEYTFCHKCGSGNFDITEEKNKKGKTVITTKCVCGEIIEEESV